MTRSSQHLLPDEQPAKKKSLVLLLSGAAAVLVCVLFCVATFISHLHSSSRQTEEAAAEPWYGA